MTYFKYIQNIINYFFHSFDSTKSQIACTSFVTSIYVYSGNVPCQINTFFNYWHRKGYSRRSDPYDVWRISEEPNDCSRADIVKSYLLGDDF